MIDAFRPTVASVGRVAFVTCREQPDVDPDDGLVVEPLAALGVTVDAAVWDDDGVDWGAYDVVVLRSSWDYASRRNAFVAWAWAVPRLANPADVVAWNTDKRYLAELATAGVPVVPTHWVGPADVWTADGEWVIKPAVSVGSKDAGRYDAGDPGHRRLAAEHAEPSGIHPIRPSGIHPTRTWLTAMIDSRTALAS